MSTFAAKVVGGLPRGGGAQHQQAGAGSQQRYNGGSPASAPARQTVGFSVASNADRLGFIGNVLIGYKVEVQVASGLVYEGVFGSLDTDSSGVSLVLKFAKVIKDPKAPTTDKTSLAEKPVAVLTISAGDLVQLFAKDIRLSPEHLSGADRSDVGFETDAAISRGRGGGVRELQPWKPDEGDDSAFFSLESTGNSSGWDQFAVNRDRFGVQTTWNEHFYTTKINRDECRISEAEAARIAREIETGMAGGPITNIHLLEERGGELGADVDEEALYGAVIRDQPPGPVAGFQQLPQHPQPPPQRQQQRSRGPHQSAADRAVAWGRAGSGVAAVAGGLAAAQQQLQQQQQRQQRPQHQQAQQQHAGPSAAPVAKSSPLPVPGASASSSAGGAAPAAAVEGGSTGSSTPGATAPIDIDIDARKEVNKVRSSLTVGSKKDRSSPYGTPKLGMSRSPAFVSPLVADPVSFSALDLYPGVSQVRLDPESQAEFLRFKEELNKKRSGQMGAEATLADLKKVSSTLKERATTSAPAGNGAAAPAAPAPANAPEPPAAAAGAAGAKADGPAAAASPTASAALAAAAAASPAAAPSTSAPPAAAAPAAAAALSAAAAAAPSGEEAKPKMVSKLNPNAKPFSLNINAKEFVPSFTAAKPAASAAPAAASTTAAPVAAPAAVAAAAPPPPPLAAVPMRMVHVIAVVPPPADAAVPAAINAASNAAAAPPAAAAAAAQAAASALSSGQASYLAGTSTSHGLAVTYHHSNAAAVSHGHGGLQQGQYGHGAHGALHAGHGVHGGGGGGGPHHERGGFGGAGSGGGPMGRDMRDHSTTVYHRGGESSYRGGGGDGPGGGGGYRGGGGGGGGDPYRGGAPGAGEGYHHHHTHHHKAGGVGGPGEHHGLKGPMESHQAPGGGLHKVPPPPPQGTMSAAEGHGMHQMVLNGVTPAAMGPHGIVPMTSAMAAGMPTMGAAMPYGVVIPPGSYMTSAMPHGTVAMASTANGPVPIMAYAVRPGGGPAMAMTAQGMAMMGAPGMASPYGAAVGPYMTAPPGGMPPPSPSGRPPSTGYFQPTGGYPMIAAAHPGGPHGHHGGPMAGQPGGPMAGHHMMQGPGHAHGHGPMVPHMQDGRGPGGMGGPGGGPKGAMRGGGGHRPPRMDHDRMGPGPRDMD